MALKRKVRNGVVDNFEALNYSRVFPKYIEKSVNLFRILPCPLGYETFFRMVIRGAGEADMV